MPHWMVSRLQQIKTVTFACEWCGKEHTVAHSEYEGKKFHTCSKECQYAFVSVYLKEKWAQRTPEERKEHGKKTGCGNQHGKGLIDYHKALRPERVERVLVYFNTPTDRDEFPRNIRLMSGTKGATNRYAEAIPMGACTMIAAHHELMKDDPERLTTAFMEEMCGVKCKCKARREEV
jgi:hypothetical protein